MSSGPDGLRACASVEDTGLVCLAGLGDVPPCAAGARELELSNPCGGVGFGGGGRDEFGSKGVTWFAAMVEEGGGRGGWSFGGFVASWEVGDGVERLDLGAPAKAEAMAASVSHRTRWRRSCCWIALRWSSA